MVSRKKKARTERVTGFGRRTIEEIVKWNQMTALRFQTRGGEDIRHPRPPFGGEKAESCRDNLWNEIQLKGP